MKHPKTLYVTIESDHDGESYFDCSSTPHGEHGDKVGIYQLVTVKTRKITEELV